MKKTLDKKRLVLREYTLDDFDGLYEILSDPETMKHYPSPYDEKGTMRWLDWTFDNYKKYGFGLFAMELKESGEFIGDCGITINPESDEDMLNALNKMYFDEGFRSQCSKKGLDRAELFSWEKCANQVIDFICSKSS